MFEKLTTVLDGFLEMGVPGYDCSVMQNGKSLYRHSNGYSDLEKKIPINGKERYNIYSCSKPITCVAALQLWEKGMFSFEDKLCDYMPEFSEMLIKTETGTKKAEKPILIKHLFEMTAGLDYNTKSNSIIKLKEDTNGKCPTREAMKYIASEPLLYEPGEKWIYSLCHDVLAALVEVISGVRFGQYAKENIFDRLGMINSTYSLPESEIDSVSAQYVFDSEKKLPRRIGNEIRGYKLGSEYESGGAGCISTVDDYLKFAESLCRDEILLKRDTVKLMTTNRLSKEQMNNYYNKETHGYGLGVRCHSENGQYKDFGWGGAAGSYLAIDIENGLTVVYAQHMLSSPNLNDLSEVYKAALECIGR